MFNHTAPAPESLSLGIELDVTADGILLRLEPLLGHLASPLRRLCLQGSPDDHITTQILDHFPSITKLVISHHCRASGKNVSALLATFPVSPLPGRTVLAPHLSFMAFNVREANLDHTAFLQMVYSRWHAGCKCTIIGLIGNPEARQPAAVLRTLRALQPEGLHLLHLEPRTQLNACFYSSFWAR
ncbi:hypothetical protein K438DRAFT_1970014 [Mycena galopus ATCC 62051]|nr:hypothetical protein K438DRAFT_1970014 [Mycena galopus ATCC 62051]